jgi:hypothetical protein
MLSPFAFNSNLRRYTVGLLLALLSTSVGGVVICAIDEVPLFISTLDVFGH